MNEEIKYVLFMLAGLSVMAILVGLGLIYFAWIGTVVDAINPCFFSYTCTK